MSRLIQATAPRTIGFALTTGQTRYLERHTLQRPNNATPYAAGDNYLGGPHRIQNVNRAVGGAVNFLARMNISGMGASSQGFPNGLLIHFFDVDPVTVVADNASMIRAIPKALSGNYIGVGTFGINGTQFQVGAPTATRLRFPVAGFAGQLGSNLLLTGRDVWYYLTVSNHTPAALMTLTFDFFAQDVT